MNPPEIEHLISKAIENRPRATKASLNLYIYDGRIVCGARIVMPLEADFITFVPPDRLENGFGDKEWKLIVEKVKELAEAEAFEVDTSHSQNLSHPTQEQHQSELPQEQFDERRRERRLRYRYPLRFTPASERKFSKAQMLNVSSGGVAFACNSKESNPYVDQKLSVRFSVPRFCPDGSKDIVSFERFGRIRRINKLNRSLQHVAVQFAEPLPFKPAEQSGANNCSKHQLNTVGVD